MPTSFPGLDDDEKRAIIRRSLEARFAGGEPVGRVAPFPLWVADLVLDEDIDASSMNPPRDDGSSVLLTGATGYLGAFVLHDLCRHTHARVHCLVRAADAEKGLQRIRTNLASYFLWDEDFRQRIVVVCGDLAKAKLGLPPREFRRLSEAVDSIVHVGAAVNFLFSYVDLRESNVLSTKEILRFAASSRLKPLHFVSTSGVFLNSHYAGRVAPEMGAPPSPTSGGYGETKWVAERLLQKARARGFPISIYRPPFIGWHTQTGAANTKDFFVRLILGSLQLQKAPRIPLRFPLTPVDHVSRSLVQIAARPASVGRNFNLVFSSGFAWHDVVEALRARLPLSVAPYESWRLSVQTSDDDNPMRALLPILPERLGAGPSSYTDILLESQVPAGYENANAIEFAGSLPALPTSPGELVAPFLARVTA